jgi:hypothetical protein
VAARVCFPDTSLKVSQMPGERNVACIELHNSSGPPAPKVRSRIADAGWPTVTAHLIFSAAEFKDLTDEHFWAIKCL